MRAADGRFGIGNRPVDAPQELPGRFEVGEDDLPVGEVLGASDFAGCAFARCG